MPENTSTKLPISFVIVTLFLLILAFFINLGLVSFIEDEGTRGTVAFEMIQSGDYITPTISGEYYYNKPPLYNMVIALSYKAFGNYSNFTMRFPMAVLTIFFGISIYLFFRKRFGQYPAFIIALSSITCGRILVYDSLHGLIDIPLAFLTFVLFVSIYDLYQKERFYLLFIVAYLISAITYLMKGLPSIVFLGISLLTLFIFKKDFKRLFSLYHIAGFLVFAIIVGGYYFIYNERNPGQLETVFRILFLESNKKSVGGNALKDTLLHLAYFPLEYWKDFLPGTLFVLFFFKKGTLKRIWKEEYIRYLFWIFFTNILVYWISPVVYARYLHMFTPLIYGILLYTYFKDIDYKDWRYKSMEILIMVFLIISMLSPTIFLVLPEMQNIPNTYFKISFLFFFMLGIFYVFYHYRQYQLFAFFMAFVVIRIAFNWFVLPIRYEEAWQVRAEKDAMRLGQKYAEKELFIADIPSEYHEPHKLIMDLSLYYLARERGEIIRLDTNIKKGALYLMDVDEIDYRKHRVVDEFFMKNNLILYLVELR